MNWKTIAAIAVIGYLGYTVLKKDVANAVDALNPVTSAQNALGGLWNGLTGAIGGAGSATNAAVQSTAQVANGLGTEVQYELQRLQGAANVAAFQATGYDITAPNVVHDMLSQIGQPAPNFETASGSQMYVASPAIVQQSHPAPVYAAQQGAHPANRPPVPSSSGGYSMASGGSGISNYNATSSSSGFHGYSGAPLGYFPI